MFGGQARSQSPGPSRLGMRSRARRLSDASADSDADHPQDIARPKSPLSFAGLRSKIRQDPVSPEAARIRAQPPAKVESPTSNASPARSTASRLFRKKSTDDLAATPRPVTPGEASGSRLPTPTHRSPRARAHSHGLSSTSSIVSNAAMSVRELTARGGQAQRNQAQPQHGPEPPLSSPSTRKVYGREDVARYRAGAPATTPPLSPSPSASASSSLAAPAQSPRNFQADSGEAAPASALGRRGTIRAGDSATAHDLDLDLEQMAAPAGDLETLASPTATPTSSGRTSFASASRFGTPSMDSSHSDRSIAAAPAPAVTDQRDDLPAYPSSASSQRIAQTPKTATPRREAARNPGTPSSRKSIFEWAPASGIPALVRRGSKNASPSSGGPLSETQHQSSSDHKASPLRFFRSASALGFRDDGDGPGDNQEGAASGGNASAQRSSEKSSQHRRKPSYGSSLFGGISGHTRVAAPAAGDAPTPAHTSTRSGLPLFRRPRTESSGANSMLGSHSNGKPVHEGDEHLRVPRRTYTNLSPTPESPVASKSPSGNRFLASLGRTRSREALRDAGQRAAVAPVAVPDSPARPSTSIGHYTDVPSARSEREGRPSMASAIDRPMPPNSSQSSSRRRRIPSIYSLASVKMSGSNGDLDFDTSETPPSSSSSSGWKFGKGWIRSRKDTGSMQSPMSGSFSVQDQGSGLASPSMNATVRKWHSLAEATSASPPGPHHAPGGAGLIFGVPLRDAVVRTRFLSPCVDGFSASTDTSSSLSSSYSRSSAGRANGVSAVASARHPRRRPSRIGLLDLGSDFSLSSELFSSATSLSSQASSLATSSSTHHHPSSASIDNAGVQPLSSIHKTQRLPVDRQTARRQYLPRFVTRCIESLETYGLDEEGVYRLTGRSSHTLRLRQLFDGRLDMSTCMAMHWDDDDDGDFDWDLDLKALPPSECDNNSVCSALKAYLRELPSAILSKSQLARLDAAIKASRGRRNDSGALDAPVSQSEPLSATFQDVEPAKWYLLRELALHLGDMTKPDVVARTKMTLNNLCLVLAPTLCIPVTSLNFIVHQRKALFDTAPPEDQQLDKVREGDLIGGNSRRGETDDDGDRSLGQFSFPSVANRGLSASAPGSLIPVPVNRSSPRKDQMGPGPVPRLRHGAEWDSSRLLSAPAGTSHRDSQASVATVTPGDLRQNGESADDSSSTVGMQPSDTSAISLRSFGSPPSSVTQHSFVQQQTRGSPTPLRSPNSSTSRRFDNDATASPALSDTSRFGDNAGSADRSEGESFSRGDLSHGSERSAKEELRDSIQGPVLIRPSQGSFHGLQLDRRNLSPGADVKTASAIFDDAHKHSPSLHDGVPPRLPAKDFHVGRRPSASSGTGRLDAVSGSSRRGSSHSLASEVSSGGSGSGSGSGSASNRYLSASTSSNSSSVNLSHAGGSSINGTPHAAKLTRGDEKQVPSSPSISEPPNSPTPSRVGRGRSGSTLDRPHPLSSGGSSSRFFMGGRASPLPPSSPRSPTTTSTRKDRLPGSAGGDATPTQRGTTAQAASAAMAAAVGTDGAGSPRSPRSPRGLDSVTEKPIRRR
ncbi:unnamed protein product [Parajaminaea phylloscopi]